MSRIGNSPIDLPAGVSVSLSPGRVMVNGPLGELSQQVPQRISIEQRDGELVVTRPTERGEDRALHGLTRTLVANMVEGVTKGFAKNLEIQGVGYRAGLRGADLELNVGYSHAVVKKAPQGITFEVPQPTQVTVKGIDKQQVGQVAAEVRAVQAARALQGQGDPLRGRVRPPQGREEGLAVPTLTVRQARDRRHRRVRRKISGTADRPRLTVHRSNRGIEAQLVDDVDGKTLAYANHLGLKKGFKGSKTDQAAEVGKLLAATATKAGIETVVFDRGGYLYHGRVKALAEGAREGGLSF